MIHWRRSYLWLAMALGVIVVVAAVLWLRGGRPGGDFSTLPTPATSEESPLPTPTSASLTTHLRSWTTGGAVLLWVALGILLALGIALIVIRWQRQDDGV